MEDEIWRYIDGYVGVYQISSLGRVKSFKCPKNRVSGRIGKSPKEGIDKYIYVSLNHNRESKRVQVHRLVAMTFLPNPYGKKYVNHINGIKSDNRLANLEWVTASENTLHAYKIGLNNGRKIKSRFKKGRYFNCELFLESIHEKRKSEGISIRNIQSATNIRRSTISTVSRGHVPDIETIIGFCVWMNKPITDFINYDNI